MKKVIFTFLLLVTLVAGYSQTTYYWVGGTTGVWASATSWNTVINGSGTSRTTVDQAMDILIFDGTNIGGGTPNTGQILPSITGSDGCMQLKLVNGADVVMYRSAVSSTATGTSIISVNGDGTFAYKDFIIDAASSLKLGAVSNAFAQSFNLNLGGNATGTISGTVRIIDGGFAKAYLTVSLVNTLNFVSGSKCYTNNTFASSYPFAPSSAGTIALGIVFQAGSALYIQGGITPYPSSTTIPISFATGSTLEIDATPTSTVLLANRTLANLIIGNGSAIVTIVADGSPNNIDNLTIASGCTLTIKATGTFPIAGNVVNNGTLNCASGYTTSHLIFDGSKSQTVSGNAFSVAAMSVATDADVTLNTNVTIGSTSSTPTSAISGKLNVGNSIISSGGTTTPGSIAFRAAAAATTTAAATLTVGSNAVVLTSATYSLANVSVGNLVTGTGIQPNAYIIATSSSTFTFTISKFATQAFANNTGTITISNNAATFTTSNAGGVDASITTTGVRSFNTGINYIFNAATNSPFTTSTNNATGNVTFNAVATTNKSQTIGGILTLANGNFSINNTDTLRLLGTASIVGTNSSQYIVTKTSGATVGTLRIDSIATTKIFPVGSVSNYLPVTITPSVKDTFNVSVFEGLTTNGLPNGTAFNATQKQSAIDAVWIINPKTNSNQNSAITLGWANALTGSRFLTFTNSQIGIGRNDGTNWIATTGTSANNNARIATASYSNYGSFSVGELGGVLPVQLVNFSASLIANISKLSWSVTNEIGITQYIIQKSNNSVSFTDIGVVTADNNTTAFTNYTFSDIAFISSSYYRLKIISVNGTITFSNILLVNNGTQFKVSTYPNPVVNTLFIAGLKGGELVVLYDVKGKTILQKNIGANASTIGIDVVGLKTGIYLLGVIANGSKFTKILIKE